jgi:hypothetical protein
MADLTTRVVNGEDTAKIPILYDLPVTYGVNLKSAEGLKDRWVGPEDILAKAKVVR